MLRALTRAVSPRITACALTFLEREPIDVGLANRQHNEYENVLRRLGARVLSLPAEPDLPDSVFVEDTLVVVDEVAVQTRPRLDSRRPEVSTTGATMSAYRPLVSINRDGHLEGGDVMRVDHTLYVGISRRTDEDGASQLARLLEPYGYEIVKVPVEHCLHLKTACTYIGQNTVLANVDWVDTARLPGFDILAIPPTEPFAGNALLVGETVVLPASCTTTAELLRGRGFKTRQIDVSELEKAEAGVTCCSVMFHTADTN